MSLWPRAEYPVLRLPVSRRTGSGQAQCYSDILTCTPSLRLVSALLDGAVGGCTFTDLAEADLTVSIWHPFQE